MLQGDMEEAAPNNLILFVGLIRKNQWVEPERLLQTKVGDEGSCLAEAGRGSGCRATQATHHLGQEQDPQAQSPGRSDTHSPHVVPSGLEVAEAGHRPWVPARPDLPNSQHGDRSAPDDIRMHPT